MELAIIMILYLKKLFVLARFIIKIKEVNFLKYTSPKILKYFKLSQFVLKLYLNSERSLLA